MLISYVQGALGHLVYLWKSTLSFVFTLDQQFHWTTAYKPG